MLKFSLLAKSYFEKSISCAGLGIGVFGKYVLNTFTSLEKSSGESGAKELGSTFIKLASSVRSEALNSLQTQPFQKRLFALSKAF